MKHVCMVSVEHSVKARARQLGTWRVEKQSATSVTTPSPSLCALWTGMDLSLCLA